MGDFREDLFASPSPIKLRNLSFGHTNIPIIPTVDNVANEGNERGILRMRLSENTAQPPNTFFKRDLAVTITDTSSE